MMCSMQPEDKFKNKYSNLLLIRVEKEAHSKLVCDFYRITYEQKSLHRCHAFAFWVFTAQQK